MFKALLGNPIIQFLIGRSIGCYMLFVGVTTRWRKVNQQVMERFQTGDTKMVACIWHGRFLLVHKMWTFGPNMPPAKFLISQSREGGIVAHASRTVGAEVIRGSAAKGQKRKGGVAATRALERHLDGGGVIGMTPDGPRGPRMRAKLGPIQVAKLAGADLMPMAWSTQNRKVFKSWDRFVLPIPFGRGALVWGNPIAPPALDASAEEIERVRLAPERELNRVSQEADRLAGASVIEPEPLPDLEPAVPAS